MKIYSKILLATMPLLLLSFVVAGGITYFLSRDALTGIAEQWLETRSREALKAAIDQEEFLKAYSLETIEASVRQAQNDATGTMSTIDVGKQGYILVVDEKGKIVFGPDPSITGTDVSAEPWFDRLNKQVAGRLSYQFHGDRYLGSFQFFEPWKWFVIATDPESEVYGAVNRLGSLVLILGAGGTLIIALVLMLLTRKVTSPLAELVQGARSVGAGELDTTIPVRSMDEIGILARSFNEMTDQLRVLYNRLEERLTTVISNAPIIVFSLDGNGSISLLEGKGLQSMSLESDDFIGRPLSAIFLGSEKVLDAATGAAQGNMVNTVATFEEQSFEIWCAPVFSSTGEVVGVIGVATDVTELVQAQQRAEEANKRVLEQNRVLESVSTKLSKYLSPQVYSSIFSGRQNVEISSQRKRLTVFFSDIANFTETADKMESEDLTQLLNHYLSEMARIALEYGATIDKYVGDAIVIFFGDPETKGVKEDALACVNMAIAMRDRMSELQGDWRTMGIENPLECRIGINTGYCTVGNFGSVDRMDYTIVGGGVNLASRMEHEAEPGEILISYETYAHVKDEVSCAGHGEISVKGIAYPVATYLVGDRYDRMNEGCLPIREETPNLSVRINPGTMTPEQREEAKQILRSALDRLDSPPNIN